MSMKCCKTIVSCAAFASCGLGGGGGGRFFASAADAPQWIGLDTTIRDGQSWAVPVETRVAGLIDTRVSDFWASLGATVRGTFRGLFMVIK